MKNEIWSEISTFLNNLRCGDVGRKTYLHFPELEEAEKIRKAKKANFETEMGKLDAEQRQQIENYFEAVQHLAFMEEERACGNRSINVKSQRIEYQKSVENRGLPNRFSL